MYLRERAVRPAGAASRAMVLGAAVLVLLLSVALTSPRAHGQADEGALVGDLPRQGGVALVNWSGGSLESLEAAVEEMASVWISDGGELVGHISGAPDFVNADFRALFAGGHVPAGPVLVVLAPAPYAGNALEIAFAEVVPDWLPGLDTRSDTRLQNPYDSFATWPVIERFPLLGEESRAFIDAARAEFEEQIGPQIPGSPIIQELNIGFDFIVASGSVVGVRFEQYQFFGANGAQTATTVWFDTVRNQRLPAVALLDGDAALGRLAEVVREALRRDRPDLALPEALEEGTAPTEENYDSIGFSPQGALVVEFDEYQVGPGASGSPRVSIPASVADELLSDFGRQAQQEVVASSRSLTLPGPAPEPDPGPPAPPPTAARVDCVQVACVALTFDDGPARPTERLLDLLSQRGSRVTFFVVGQSVPYRPQVLARMVAEGHEVGNHTMDHRDLTRLGGQALRAQVDEASAVIEAASGVRPAFLRPPYGAVDDAVAEAVGLPLVLWSVDPRDWADHDAALVAQRVAADTQRGSIVLLHDIHETTVDAVSAILDDFERRGLTAVTVSELLGEDLVPGRVYRSQSAG